MEDKEKTKEQLIKEIHELRKRVASLEKKEMEFKRVEHALQIKGYAIASCINMIIFADFHGNMMGANHAFLNLFGYKNWNDITGKPLSHFFVDGCRVMEILDHLKNQACWQGDLLAKRENGDHFPTHMAANFVKDQNGNPICVMLSGMDMTAQKKTEASLQKSKQRFKDLVDMLPQIIFETDRTGKITFINRQILESHQYGYTEEDLEKGVNVFDMIAPQDIERAAKNFKKRILSQKLDASEYLFVAKNGNKFPVQVFATPILKNKKVVGLRGIAIDITEQKQIEQEIQTNLKFLQRIIDTIPSPVFYKGKDLAYQGCNEAFSEQVIGLPKKEIIGRTLFAFSNTVCPKLAATYNNYDKEMLQNPGRRIYEAPILCPDGKKRKFLCHKATYNDIDGNVGGIIGVMLDISEIKFTQEALKESETKFRTITSSAKDAIVMINHLGEVTFWNPSAQEIFGYSEEEILGKNLHHLLAPEEYHNDHQTGFERFVTTGKGKALGKLIELQALKKSGAKVPVELNIAPVKIKDHWEAIAIVRDITERNEAQRALHESEALNRAIIENSPVGISVRDKTGKLLLVNGAWKKIWNLTDEDIEKREKNANNLTFEERYPYLKSVAKEIENVFQVGGEYFVTEVHTATPKPNSTDWVSQRIYAIQDEAGSVEKIVVLTEDVTDRKQAELALKVRMDYEEAISYCSQTLIESRELSNPLQRILRKLLRTVQVCRVYIFENFYDIDNELCMRQLYEAAGEDVHSELENPELLHLSYKDVSPNLLNALEANKFYGGIVTQMPQPDQDHLIPQDILSILILPIWDEGELWGFIGFDDCKTERKWKIADIRLLQTIASMIGTAISKKRAEQAIRKANAELIEKNTKITEQKEELAKLVVQISMSEEELREANAAKDKFFSIIAHDLRNPMTNLLFTSDYLSQQADELQSERMTFLIKNMSQSAKHLRRLLENLLEWARAQTGRILYNPENIDLNYVSAVTLDLLCPGAIEKNIHLHSEIQEDTYVLADQNMLNTLLRNLISNAIKFTKNDGEIKISAKDDGDFIQITVADSGIGINKERLSQMFRIDQRNKSTKGTAGERGTGLGLILCKEFVEKHGGKIWVESILDEGSKFIFTIPKAKNIKIPMLKKSQKTIE